MSLSAAMIIAKLDEGLQRQFKSQFAYLGKYEKTSAESFVNSVFLDIPNSIWAKSDSDFAGGCGRKCAECVNNTANQGCLFWEMNSKENGKCTDRKAHWQKTLAFILRVIDAMGDRLVKAGQPLEHGKTVLCLSETYGSSNGEADAHREELKAAIADRGLLLVDPHAMFKGWCRYDLDDVRVKEMLENGEVYRCISLFSFTTPTFKHEVWYTKSDKDVAEASIPYEIRDTLSQLKWTEQESNMKGGLRTAGAKALYDCTPTKGNLTENEKALLLLLMLKSDMQLLSKSGMSLGLAIEEQIEYVKTHPEIWNQIFRGWMYSMMHNGNENLYLGAKFLDEFGAAQCPEQYQKAKDKVFAKRQKDIAKLTKKLNDMGYDSDGKPLQKEEDKSLSAQKQFEEMKKKHPDAILLFRVGDFYECYEEDAVKASNTLGLVLTERGCTKLAGFPHHSLDTYLPKLIQSGHRVAICEQDKKTNQ